MAVIPKKKKETKIGDMLLPYFPNLQKKLLLADSEQDAPEFLEKVAITTAIVAIAALLLTAAIFHYYGINFLYLIPLALLYPNILFTYLMLYPTAMVRRRQREIDYEVLFAARHLVIALKSGLPLFSAITGLSRGYGRVSKEFAKIAEAVSVGTPITQAIREVAATNPSKYFVRILMQISNSLSSGADVGDSLNALLDQISREQLIALREYGQKLTPIVMFFMIIGIILPSLGVVLTIVLLTVISGGVLGVTFPILLYVLLFIAIVQYLFLAYIESSRPKYIL